MAAKKGDKHPKMKGNKFAAGNKGGRPNSISDRIAFAKQMVAEFEHHLDTLEQHKMPIFIESWCRRHNVSDDTIRSYRNEDKEFSVLYQQARDIQKEIFIIGGMKGWFNSTFTIFAAKNVTDMRDRVETDITSGGQPITGMIISHAD